MACTALAADMGLCGVCNRGLRARASAIILSMNLPIHSTSNRQAHNAGPLCANDDSDHDETGLVALAVTAKAAQNMQQECN